ncbi:Sporulation initiation phosphotransferase F [bacterium HR24]|jgi:CheY-like chemotaxis protein|nr:Sporulation initiation phosphotransferase F [bacterium HR24]
MTALCLVVEDEPAILRLVTMVVQDLGFQVIAVPDAEAALEAIAREKPQVVLTDVRLPGMDGVELARRIRSDPALAGVPVLLMSAYGEPRDHDGDGFLSKPFDLDQLIEFLRRHLPL